MEFQKQYKKWQMHIIKQLNEVDKPTDYKLMYSKKERMPEYMYGI